MADFALIIFSDYPMKDQTSSPYIILIIKYVPHK